MDITVHRVHRVVKSEEAFEGDESCPPYVCTTLTISSTTHTGEVLTQDISLFSDASIQVEIRAKI